VVNADKPHLWKADIAASVELYNAWFMKFAPKAYRKTRVETTKAVEADLLATNDTRECTPATIQARPRILPTLRMSTAPPIARDRLIGLAGVRNQEVARKHAVLWRYLDSADEALRQRYLMAKRDPWYRQEERGPAPFLCTYMGRGAGAKKPFRFIWNQSQAIATNVYLLLYPAGPLRELLESDRYAAGYVFEFLQDIRGEDLRGEGRVYGGGLHKIEPRELARISAVSLCERFPKLRPSLLRQKTFSFPVEAAGAEEAAGG
jgi:hypothetical protein